MNHTISSVFKRGGWKEDRGSFTETLTHADETMFDILVFFLPAADDELFKNAGSPTLRTRRLLRARHASSYGLQPSCATVCPPTSHEVVVSTDGSSVSLEG